MTLTDNPDRTLTVTLTPQERAVLDRALADHGADVVRDLFTAWLTDRQRHQDDADIAAAKLGTADPATRARVRARLGL